MAADHGQQKGVLDDRVGQPHQRQGKEHVTGADLPGTHLMHDESAAVGQPHDHAHDGQGARFPADAEHAQHRGQEPDAQVGDPEPGQNPHENNQTENDQKYDSQVFHLGQCPTEPGGIGRGRIPEQDIGLLQPSPGRVDPVQYPPQRNGSPYPQAELKHQSRPCPPDHLQLYRKRMGHQNHGGQHRDLGLGHGILSGQRDEYQHASVDVVHHGRGPHQPHGRRKAHKSHDRAKGGGHVLDPPHLLNDAYSNEDGDHDFEQGEGDGGGFGEDAAGGGDSEGHGRFLGLVKNGTHGTNG